MITFKQQFDKLTEAYIKDEVHPYKNCGCFIGNLLNKTSGWSKARYNRNFRGGWEFTEICRKEMTEFATECIDRQSEGMYSIGQIYAMESTFLKVLNEETLNKDICNAKDILTHPNYEEALFKAFCAALDHLKLVHESKGEVVDEFSFKKRELQVA